VRVRNLRDRLDRVDRAGVDIAGSRHDRDRGHASVLVSPDGFRKRLHVQHAVVGRRDDV